MLVAEGGVDDAADAGEDFELMSVVAKIPVVFPISFAEDVLRLIYTMLLAILGHPIRHYPRFTEIFNRS